MQVFAVNGYPRSGKGSFVEFVKLIAKLKYNLVISSTSMIDPIKTLLYNNRIWSPDKKTEKDRNMLSNMKDLLDEYCDYSYESVRTDLIGSKLLKEAAVFVDAREPKDLQRLVDDFGATTIFIKRDNHETASNHADSNVEKFEYDVVINNNDTLDDLKKAAEAFVDVYIK